MAIVAVFGAGLVKLWWNNRLMLKQEVLDEEKRTRVEEMRRSGLSIKRASEIPFGVRALQKGVEVDGIWISRPASLSEKAPIEKIASSTTLAGQDTDSHKKEGFSDTERSTSATPITLSGTIPRSSTGEGSIFQRLNDSDSLNSSSQSAHLLTPLSKFASQGRRHPPSALNEDTLRRLEGQPQPKPLYDTYIPTSRGPSQRQPRQSSAASSSGESVDSRPPSVRSAGGKSYTSSHSSRLYMAAAPQYHHHQQQHSYIPVRAPSGYMAYTQHESPYSTTAPIQGQGQEQGFPPAPEPTFGPGDLHLNRSSRKVNSGFEILPAGTFGSVVPTDMGDSSQGSRPGNRLRKKSEQNE